ncbi:MAG: HEPN domain-containing protein [Defluviitaleaceae bacterium]|nr:HEPN domain-containing protein [Defluviitaleaceae bacterium]
MQNDKSIAAHMQKSQLDIKAAEILHAHGLYSHAISCSYYAVFHAIKALMETNEITADTHHQVLGLFNKHFVHPGRVSSYVSHAAYDLFLKRNTLEYDPRELIGEEGSHRGLELAKNSVDEITALLAT